MRLPDDTEPTKYQPGDYGRRGPYWFGKTPNGYLANLSAHQITEHPDGTITCAPSIRVFLPPYDDRPEKELWHGHLVCGVWTSC